MTSPSEEDTILVSIKISNGKSVNLQVSPPNTATINLLFQLHPDLVYITNYDLVSKSGSIFSEAYDLKKDADTKTGQIDLELHHLPYDRASAIEHARNQARICFSLSSNRQRTDCTESIVGWIARTYDQSNHSNTNFQIDDLDEIYPAKFNASNLPLILKHIDLSKESLTPKELIEGHFLKLSIKTIEKKSFVVYASENGWKAKNNTKLFPTLHELICSISPFYSDNYSLISEKWCKLRSAEKLPYIPSFDHRLIYTPCLVKKNGDLKPNSLLSLFETTNDTTNSLFFLTLDDLISDAKESGESDKVIKLFEIHYLQKSVDAVSAIKEKTITPIFGDSSYIYQDIFVSDINVAAEANKKRGGLQTANRVICNEVNAYSQLVNYDHEKSDNHFRVIRPICIDLFTNRYVAQTTIPGFLQGQSKVVYGYDSPEKTNFRDAGNVTQSIEADMKNLGIAPSHIKGSKQPVFTSAETNAVQSIDGYLYLCDFKRITPRDANYPDPVNHYGCVIRSEAVIAFSSFAALKQNEKELIDLGGDPDNLYHYKQSPNQDVTPETQEKIEKLEKRRQEILQNSQKVCFDINALTPESQDFSSLSAKNFPDNIKEIAKFVVNYLIPRFITEYANESAFLIDGKTIVNEMHTRGINARYLGKILELFKQKAAPTTVSKYFILSLESEIISRSFKAIKRSEKASIESLIDDLNLLLGYKNDANAFNQLFTTIQTAATDKFNVTTLSPPQEAQRIMILRSVLRSFGISLTARKGITQRALTLNDVSDISPLLKFPFTRNARFAAALDLATTIFSQEGASDQALTMFNVALQFSCDGSVDPLDQGIAVCYFYLSLIFDQRNRPEDAFNACLVSLIIQEHHSDQLAPEIIIRYSLLARYAKLAQRNQLAFAFADRAACLGRIVAPSHPWVGVEFTMASDLAIEISPEFAIKYAESRLNYCNQLLENNEDKGAIQKQIALLYSSMAKALLRTGDFKTALDRVNKALELDPKNEELRNISDMVKSHLK